MRRLRITVAMAAVAGVLGALASPALAKNERPKAFFGEFVASVPTGPPITPSTPAIAKTKEGALDVLEVGNPNHPLFNFACESLMSQGNVTAERSPTFKTEIKFHKCTGSRRLAENVVEGEPEGSGPSLKTKIGPGFEMEFHANGAVGVGGELSNEARITKGTSVEIKVKGALCKLVIPPQTVPKNGLNEEKEFEGGSYRGEKEPTTRLKTYPDGFKEKSEIDWELTKMIVEIPVGPGTGCSYEKEPGGKFNEETHSVVEHAIFEGELEEIEIKKGEFFFEDLAEHEAKEKEV
jgi:hypothetical protein